VATGGDTRVGGGGGGSVGGVPRLYSYLSGSEGEASAPQHPPASSTKREQQQQQRAPRRQSWDQKGGVETSSSCSSLSENASPLSDCISDQQLHVEPVGNSDYLCGRTVDTLDSNGVGGNVYSRIRDSGETKLIVFG